MSKNSRKSLSDLIQREASQPQVDTEPIPQPVSPVLTPDPEVQEEGPRYATFIRKETRLTEEQISQLGILARRLNRKRKNREERITENTLIRVAIDLLLTRADDLEGDNEAELRLALGLSEVTE